VLLANGSDDVFVRSADMQMFPARRPDAANYLLDGKRHLATVEYFRLKHDPLRVTT
jgi:hypothetical protein